MIHSYPVTAAAAQLLASATPICTKDAGDPFEVLAKKFGDHTAEVLKKLGATTDDLNTVKAQLFELEQKGARKSYGGGLETKTLGDEFTSNPDLKSFSEYRARPTRFSVNMKATITSGGTSGGSLGNTYKDGVVAMPQRVLSVRDLLPSIHITDGSVEYPKQTVRTNAAGMVAETAEKPESAYAFEMVPCPIRTIAHWVPASRQILDDAPQLKGIIDSELMYGLKLKEDSQLLTGDNSGQNLHGLIPQSTAYNPEFSVEMMTNIDQIGLAILQNALANMPADGVIVHPSDWMRMRLQKNNEGDYILGDPAKDTARVLFGLPVVDTIGMPASEFLVGNFQMAATLYDRWEARIEVSTEHADFFTRNLVAILCEERIGLAVKRPAALTHGEFELV